MRLKTERPYALPRSRRLLSGDRFSAAFRHGCKSRDSYFIVYAAPGEPGLARLGLAVSRRAAPTAVARNRIKRMAREAFRHHQASLEGLDIVVVAQAQARDAPKSALRAGLQQHWLKVIAKCKKS